MSSTSFSPTATMKNWKKTDATIVLMKRDWFCTLFSWFTVKTVHICQCFSESHDRSLIGAFLPDLFSVRCQFSDLSNIPLWIDGRSGLPAPIYPLRCTSPSVQPILSCESRYTGSRWKRSWILSQFFLIHLFRALWAKKCYFSASVLPCRAPQGRPTLMT